MIRKLLFVVTILSQLVFSCKKEITENQPSTSDDTTTLAGRNNCNPRLKIAVVSDIHYMHPSLLINGGASGTAFQNYINSDPKLVQYSDRIWREVMAELKAENPDILLVPGDLTKDGEKIGHQAMAGFLHQLRSRGIKVYVIPGNHDINNAKAKLYDGNNDFPVDKTSPTDFETIYGDFGYNNAMSRDASSLSYVVQLHPGLRLIAIDASKYEEYGPSGDVAEGRIKPATLTWILDQLALAKKQNVTVFAMMHHNLIEHYAGQTTIDPGYVVDDWPTIANKLMDAGLKVIFTGHYHANDIASRTYNGNKLFDIETGSLVTPPIPYRIIEVNNNHLQVKTKTVQSIAVKLPDHVSFPRFANDFLSQHLDGYFSYYLASIGVPAPVVSFAAPLFRNGIMAHFAGDEKMPPDQRKKIEQLATMTMSTQLSDIVTTWWTDTGEKDNNTVVNY